MFSSNPTIGYGDIVLVFISRGNIKPTVVTEDEVINTRYGHFAHNDMVGAVWGTQLAGQGGKGFVHLLRPTPELWTLSLPHRTQIVYTHDSLYIMQRMEVQAGLRVLEAGTGSALFTHAFSRTVADQGHLYTYEFHEPRYLEAKAELEAHGLNNTTITHRDVCAKGFTIDGAGFLNADAVFLDLPSPWDAITQLDPVMAADKKINICCFSPCIEQVDRTVKALQEHGWTKIEMVEVNNRRWEARREMVKDVLDVVKRLKNIHQRKQQGIELLRELKAEQEALASETELSPTPETTPQPKRAKKEKVVEYNPFGKGLRVREGDEGYQWEQVTRVEPEIKTHTSYLTFAVKIPWGKQTKAVAKEVAKPEEAKPEETKEEPVAQD